MRSRDSRTAASPSPTIVNVGRPGRMSTSTHTCLGSTPSMANVATRASMPLKLGRLASQVCHAVCQSCASPTSEPELNCHSVQPTCCTSRRSVPGMSTHTGRHLRLGALGESLAAEHLQRRGFRIIERNYRTRWGELDIVAYDGRTIAFCEVKTRMHGGGLPLEAIGGRKRARVRKMAGSWMSERRDRPSAEVIRCDAIGVTFDRAGRL